MKKLFYRLLLTAYCVLPRAYLSNAQDSMNVHLLYHWKDSTLTDLTSHQSIYNEVFGFVQDGREYGVIGSTLGAHIFDVTDAQNIFPVITIPAASQGSSVVNRDYDFYNGYLYMVGDQAGARFQIADMQFLPDSAPMVYDSNALFTRAHTITVDPINARLYANGGAFNPDSLNHMSIYDISNPAEPTLLLNCSSLPIWEVIQYVHDSYVKDDTAYCHAGTRGLFVMDFTDIINPLLLGSVTQYPQQGYNHSGWLHEDGTVYAQADETHGFDVKLFDVSDLSDISVIDTRGSGISEAYSIPHNVVFRGDFLYVSYYHDGLYIFNMADPEHSYISGFYDTCVLPDTANYRGCWGVYPFLPSGKVLASDMQNGFYVFDVSDALTGMSDKPEEEKTVVFPNPFRESFSVSIPDGGKGAYTYELLDVNGKVVQHGSISRSISSITTGKEVSAGGYLLRLSGKEGVVLKRVVKE
jgi:choice-of-anchor B domain-containing protein